MPGARAGTSLVAKGRLVEPPTSGLSRSPDRPALHYVLFVLPTFTSPVIRRDLVTAQVLRLFVTLTLTIMAQAIRAI